MIYAQQVIAELQTNVGDGYRRPQGGPCGGRSAEKGGPLKIVYAAGLSQNDSSQSRLWALERLGHRAIALNVYEYVPKAYIQTLSLWTTRKTNFDRMKHAIQFPAFRRYGTSRWSVAIKCPSAGHQPMPYGTEGPPKLSHSRTLRVGKASRRDRPTG